ncbi:MAG: response regulator transcription factor [Eubacterium sp.]|nr:response regulator transcription factor [Eubacterium sp.]
MNYDCLIIDDEKTLADNTCEYFNMFEITTKAVYSEKEATAFFEENTTRLILLDINLSDGSGFELCKTIREKYDTPILFISARNTDDDKIIALNIGGDDYIEKPYSLGVLLAKVRVVLKRYGDSDRSFGETGYDDGYLKIDSANKTVTVDGTEKRITNMEYKLLKYLTDNRDRLITKNELFENVWSDKFTTDGTLNVHIRKLREEIEKDPKNPAYIETIWKEGYKFNSK